MYFVQIMLMKLSIIKQMVDFQKKFDLKLELVYITHVYKLFFYSLN